MSTGHFPSPRAAESDPNFPTDDQPSPDTPKLTHMPFFQDNRILVFLLTLVTAGALVLSYFFLRVHSNSMPNVGFNAIAFILCLFVLPVAYNAPIAIAYPRFSKVITEYPTPGPILSPPTRTTFVQIRLLLQVLCFVAHIFTCGLSLFSSLELLLDASSTESSQFVVSAKLFAWFCVVVLAVSTAWLSISASNDELRSLRNYSKVQRAKAGLDPLDTEYQARALFYSPTSPTAPYRGGLTPHNYSIPPPISDQSSISSINGSPGSPTAAGSPTQFMNPHSLDFHHQTLPFSSLSFLPHHDNYTDAPEPYNIVNHQERIIDDPRIRAAILSLIFTVCAAVTFALAILNVDENEDGVIYTQKAPGSWYLLLSFALLPLPYNLYLCLTYPRNSTSFSTEPKVERSIIGLDSDGAGGLSGNLAASSGVLDDFLTQSMISPSAYIKKVNSSMKRFKGRNPEHSDKLMDQVNHDTGSSESRKSNDTNTKPNKNRVLVPFKDKQIGLLVIIIQLIGLLFRVVITLGLIFISTAMTAMGLVSTIDDPTHYFRWVVIWSLMSCLGIMVCSVSLRAVGADFSSYRAYDRYYNSWLMFVGIPQRGAANKLILTQLSEEY